jgi:nitronate monooxygenase
MSRLLDGAWVPLIQAPMAGGPSTPSLTVAVAGAGAIGFLAGGYRSADALRGDIDDVRARTTAPFGVNLFADRSPAASPDAVAAHLAIIGPLAAAHAVELGPPTHDDDHLDEKLELVLTERPTAVSFTFGLPDAATIATLRAAGIEVWATITSSEEATTATAAGVDVLVAQGSEAGGHRGSFVDGAAAPVGLDELLGSVVDLGVPVVASGGLMDGADVRRALGRGARAAQLGTAFLLTPEAGTNPVHRAAVSRGGPTVLTRTFTGRLARGLRNAWTELGRDDLPSAYPEVHHLTSPLRAHGRDQGDPDLVNLWAGTGVQGAHPVPAADVVATIARELDAG